GFSERRAPLLARGPEGEPGRGRSPQFNRRSDEGNTCPDRPRLVAGPKAVDRADSRDDETAAPARKPRSRLGQTNTGGPARNQRRLQSDHVSGSPLSRTPAEAGWPLTPTVGQP